MATAGNMEFPVRTELGPIHTAIVPFTACASSARIVAKVRQRKSIHRAARTIQKTSMLRDRYHPSPRWRRLQHWITTLASACALATTGTGATADSPERSSEGPTLPWSTGHVSLERDLQAGLPLVVKVLVPLCSNDQIWCGADFAGQPGNPGKNLYWGAVFGARRHLDRPTSGWTRLGVRAVDSVVLEQAIYARPLPPGPWGLAPGASPRQIVVLEAIHGSHIDSAVHDLVSLAARGGAIEIQEGDLTRSLPIHVVGYAGHNRLLDPVPPLPPLAPLGPREAPIPAFVLACYSSHTFDGPLQRVGSKPLVMTRALMAPEGYVVDAVLRGLGENLSQSALRARAVTAYAKWQRLSRRQASAIFARAGR